MGREHFASLKDKNSGQWRVIEDMLENLFNHADEVYYIPKEFTTRDDIFGEDDGINVYDKSLVIPMYMLSVTNFEDAGTLFSKFGINVHDKMKVVCLQQQYFKITGYENAIMRVGDMLYIPLLKRCGKSMWEIRSVDVADGDKLMQFGDEHFYIFGCDVLKKDRTDKFATPIAEINNINNFMDQIQTLESQEVAESVSDGSVSVTFNPDDPFSDKF